MFCNDLCLSLLGDCVSTHQSTIATFYSFHDKRSMKHTMCHSKRATRTVLFIFEMVPFDPSLGIWCFIQRNSLLSSMLFHEGFFLSLSLFWVFLIPWSVAMWGYLNITILPPSKMNKENSWNRSFLFFFLFLSLIDSFGVLPGPSCSVNALQPSERNTIQCRGCMHVLLCHLLRTVFSFLIFLWKGTTQKRVINDKPQFSIVKP